MADENETDQGLAERDAHLARVVLIAFLLTFIAARVVVFLIMSRRIPDLYLRLGGTHVHHLNHGIFLLAAVGAYLLFFRPEGRRQSIAALVYGIGLALTFDEFGMWR
jgi:cytochrome bd-type quinol oxidase subunit 2